MQLLGGRNYSSSQIQVIISGNSRQELQTVKSHQESREMNERELARLLAGAQLDFSAWAQFRTPCPESGATLSKLGPPTARSFIKTVLTGMPQDKPMQTVLPWDSLPRWPSVVSSWQLKPIITGVEWWLSVVKSAYHSCRSYTFAAQCPWWRSYNHLSLQRQGILCPLVPSLTCTCPLIRTQIHITKNKVNLSMEERKANLHTEFLKYAFYHNLAQKCLFVVLGLNLEPRIC